jgi:cytochrome bd-type quinol oxidase subunit 1
MDSTSRNLRATAHVIIAKFFTGLFIIIAIAALAIMVLRKL